MYVEAWTTLYKVMLINAVIISIILVCERRRPEKTISWILFFMLFPPIALVIYIFLGRNWKKSKLGYWENDIYEEILLDKESLEKKNLEEYKELIALIRNSRGGAIYTHNTVKAYEDGEKKFEELLEDIKKAKHHIHLEYYIWRSDEIGEKMRDALIEKSKAGVEVRIVLDRLGGAWIKKEYIKELKDSGVDVQFYSYSLAPLFKFINTQINFRNHRKIVVIDGHIGYMGGMNVGDEYLGKGKLGIWRDSHIRIEGDAVTSLQKIFLEDYITIKRINEKNFNTGKYFRKDNVEVYFPCKKTEGDIAMQIIKNGPESLNPTIMHGMVKMILEARESIVIATPYFIPSDTLMHAIKIARLSGVDIKILTPGRADHKIVYYASKTYLKELEEYGVKIYTYDNKRFFHSKYICIDKKICTSGTTNIDIRSFELNYEVNAFIYNKKFTTCLENQFYKDLKDSKRVMKADFDVEPLHIKMAQSIARIFSSLL